MPTESAVPIGDIAAHEAPARATVGNYLVALGGLDAVELKAGETVVVNGATGSFGSAGVAVALAMGAARVVATGVIEVCWRSSGSALAGACAPLR